MSKQLAAVIISVLEEHDTNPYGQYLRWAEFARVPQAGEWVFVGGKATTVQNVIWHMASTDILEDGGADAPAYMERVEVYLSPRLVGPSFPETVNELFDDGFLPMRPDGSTVSWQEDAELREAVATAAAGGISEHALADEAAVGEPIVSVEGMPEPVSAD